MSNSSSSSSGGPPDLAGLFAQAQKLQQQVAEAQERARSRTVEAQSGGGLVTVVMNGAFEVVSLKLDPLCVDNRDVPMLEDLVRAAMNQALTRVQEMMQGEMQKVAGGLLPGLGGLGGGGLPGLF